MKDTRIEFKNLDVIMGTIQNQDVPEYLKGENQWESPENVELYEAALKGDIHNLRLALDKGAKPNYFHRHGDDCPSALHTVARFAPSSCGDAAMCAKELIGRGAVVSIELVSNKNTPVHEAAYSGSLGVFRVLIDADKTTCIKAENSFGNTALHAASRSGSIEIARLLLENGADPNKQNKRGSTALHLACFLARSVKESENSLSQSCSSSNGDKDNLIDSFVTIAAILICNNETLVDIQDENGYTPLHVASQRGCNEMVKLLIDSGASLKKKTYIDSKGRGGRTPKGMAIFGESETTRDMIEKAMDAIDCGERVATRRMAKELESKYLLRNP